MTARAVLFDLDGTLVHLPVEIEKVREQLAVFFAARGYEGVFRPILSAIDAAAGTVARASVERDALIEQARGFIDRAEVRAAAWATACPGASGAVKRARDNGWSIGIVTDNGSSCVRPALDNVEIALPTNAVIVARDHVSKPKPDPAGVRLAVAQLLPKGGELWMVGDSVRDLVAARAAASDLPRVRLSIAAVTTGRSSRDELAEQGPDQLLSSLEDFAL